MINSNDTFLRGINDGALGLIHRVDLSWNKEDRGNYERGFTIGRAERNARKSKLSSVKRKPLTISSINNPTEFINSYVKFQSPDGQNGPARLWDFQEDILNHEFTKHRFNIVKKDRNVGFTWLIAGYLAWKIITNPNFKVGVVAPTDGMEMKIVRSVRSIITELDLNMFDIPLITADNKRNIELSNNSSVHSIPPTLESFKSERLDMVVIDEAAFINDMAFFWMDVVIPTQGYNPNFEVIVASSPATAGISDWFNIAWKLSVEGNTKLNPVRINLSMVPTFTIEARRKMLESMGKHQYLLTNG